MDEGPDMVSIIYNMQEKDNLQVAHLSSVQKPTAWALMRGMVERKVMKFWVLILTGVEDDCDRSLKFVQDRSSLRVLKECWSKDQ